MTEKNNKRDYMINTLAVVEVNEIIFTNKSKDIVDIYIESHKEALESLTNKELEEYCLAVFGEEYE